MKLPRHPASTIGLIAGTSLMTSDVIASWKRISVENAYGMVDIREGRGVIFLQRHGIPPVPPHRINHRANIQAMKDRGVSRVFAINSVGSLKAALKPGSFIIPDDFLSLWHIPTFFDNEMRFMIPEMDSGLSRAFRDLCEELKVAVKHGGIYVQTAGPRLETRAEIGMLKHYGDVVGMTMASEATLCMELGIPYVSLCSIDNYCNGIMQVPLTMDEIGENVRRNAGTIETIIESIIRRGVS